MCYSFVKWMFLRFRNSIQAGAKGVLTIQLQVMVFFIELSNIRAVVFR